MPNQLIHESSPYLLQHAHNPVNWMPWNETTLAKAQQENKLLLISIGYSACHWCHVMEHESFESEEVAQLMNQHFINIKIDREERPDIDMVYMGAVQLMTGQGGWPLNCFALPNGKPIYGGTYFSKQQWMQILKNLAELFQTNPQKVYDYAEQLTQGLAQLEMPNVLETEQNFDEDVLQQSVQKWKLRFDKEDGGTNRAPKFPMPNNYLFLLYYQYFYKDSELQNHLRLTLTKMAYGGIYDQIGGGFARYSTDMLWKVPHFEKMLYDNAQLISLYTQAYKQNPNQLYKDIVYESIEFVKQELLNTTGGFYSALDADSEGVEGKFYVWKKEELQTLIPQYYHVFADYYNVNNLGYWEEDNYILMRQEDDDEIAARHHISLDELSDIIKQSKLILLAHRNKRVKPGLDNKIITSWNALMIKALCEAYLVFDEDTFKQLAVSNTEYLCLHCLREDGSLLHLASTQKMVSGFLEDYAFTIDAFIHVYLVTANLSYLYQAKRMCDYAIQHFYEEAMQTFFYTDASKEKLIVRKAEWSDNVIPASSSQMALNLYQLSIYFNEPSYLQISKNLLHKVLKEIVHYGAGYSNWSILLLWLTQASTEVVITGNESLTFLKSIYKQAPPHVVFAISTTESDLPLLKNRYNKTQTQVYVCKNKACQLPTSQIDEVIKHLN